MKYRNGHAVRRVGRTLGSQEGQASTEYALIFCAFLAMLTVMALLWRSAHSGWREELSYAYPSHSIDEQGALPELQDILLF